MAEAKLRGTGSGVVVDLTAADSVAMALGMLESALEHNLTFVAGASLTIDMPATDLSDDDVRAVLAACSARGVEVAAVTVAGRGVHRLAPAARRTMRRGREPGAELTSPVIVSGECGVVIGTVRSGHAVTHPGNVIIFGDVNAGAQIVAGASVVVWGTLRGSVEAGAAGNADAVVCALSLEPTLLRIGQHIARAPDGPAPVQQAEMARVQSGAIVVEAWAGKRPRLAANRAQRFYRSIEGALQRALKGVR